MPCIASPSRRHRRPVRRERSIDTQTTGTSANLSHIADITHRPHLGPTRNSSPISDVRTKSPWRLSDLCHMRHVRQTCWTNCRTRSVAPKKEAGFPAPLAMTNKVYFVFFLATAIAAYKRRSLHVVVSGARLSSLCWEIRGFAALPRDRCASSFSQSMARKHFYTGSNLNWCRLNLFREQGR